MGKPRDGSSPEEAETGNTPLGDESALPDVLADEETGKERPNPPPPPPDPCLGPIKVPVSSRSKDTSLPPPYPPIKPTAKVLPYTEEAADEDETEFGMTGLKNLGNTCFMNSGLQVLLNTPELKEFFASKAYALDLNEDNVLGMGGKLAVSFASLVSEVWSGRHSAYDPSNIKSIMGRRHAQFQGNLQHDAQEFLSFLLDGLHEDLNRVKAKPVTEPVEGEGRSDAELAEASWHAYKARNNSILVDLFHGLLKSRLKCPKCERVSITFDPYVFLPVPFPKKLRQQRLYFWPASVSQRPLKFSLEVEDDAKVRKLLQLVGHKMGVSPGLLRMFEVYSSKVYKLYKPEDLVKDIVGADIIHVWEELDPEAAGEEVVNLIVYQRLIYPASRSAPSYCSQCREPPKPDARFKACSQCYAEFYCDHDCQRDHWTIGGHGAACKASESPDLVGCPFHISIPRSQLTYPKLKSMMEARAIHSVDLFMPPQSNASRFSSLAASSPTSLFPEPSSSVATQLETSECETTMMGDPSSSESDTAIPMDLEDPCPSQSTSNLRPTDQEMEVGTPAHSPTPPPDEPSSPPVPDDPTDVEEDPQNRPLELYSPEAKKAIMSTPEKAGPTPSAKVRIVLGQPSADGRPTSQGYRLYNIRHVNLDGKTRYTLQNPKAKPMTPSDKTAVLDCLKSGDFIAMDWLNKLGSDDFLFVDTRKEVNAESSLAGAGGETESKEAGKQQLNIRDLLALFTQTEKLTPEEAWYCSACKEHVEADKSLLLWHLPDVQIVQLKRFIYNGNHVWRMKDERGVDYPIKGLDFSPYLCKGAPLQETVYDLVGVVNHIGSSFFGHYTALAKLVPGKKSGVNWRNFNDSVVTKASGATLHSDNAYLLFYRRRGLSALGRLEPYADRMESELEAALERVEVLMETTEESDSEHTQAASSASKTASTPSTSPFPFESVIVPPGPVTAPSGPVLGPIGSLSEDEATPIPSSSSEP